MSTRSWTASSRERPSRHESTRLRHVEAVGLRSAGPDDRRRPAFARLQGHRRRAPGQVLRARRQRADRRSGEGARLRGGRQAARQPGHRELSCRGRAVSIKFVVVVFPGSNCDHDSYHAAKDVLGQDAECVWHKETSLKGADVVILPGGFAHGDYLRTGAIARFSPIMPAVIDFANAGGPVLGICNGFQVLLESGLLPGAMLRNRDLRFHCEQVYVRVERTDTPFTAGARERQVLRMPVAHGEGNYFVAPEVVRELEDTGRVVFRYCDARGEITD